MTAGFSLMREAQERHFHSKKQQPSTSSPEEGNRSFIETARRAQIIQCGVEILAQLGYGRASLAQIAKRADVSTGVILYYFQNKEELFQEIQRQVVALYDAVVLERMDMTSPTTALRTIIEANISFLAENPNEAAALRQLYFAFSHTNPSQYDPYPAAERRKALYAILEAGQQTGEFGSFDLWTAVRAIGAALDQTYSERFREPELDFARHAKELVALFDRALRKDTK
jgi:TetR/AcrR family transcriptional regulator, fatty acid metabolism regulator protein